MNPDELREVLEAAGRQEPPEPRAEFLRDLEAGLTATRVVAPPAPRSTGRVVAAVAAAIALVVGVAVFVGRDDGEQQLTTEPAITSTTAAPSTTTSSEVAPTTTSTPAATSTTVIAPTTSIVPVTTTVTTVPETTTTTAPATTTTVAPENLRLVCATSQDPEPAIVCEWSASTNPGLDHYRLWKHTGDGPDQDVYAGADRRFRDTDVRVGANLIYEVTALAADGTVLAHSDTRVTCC